MGQLNEHSGSNADFTVPFAEVLTETGKTLSALLVVLENSDYVLHLKSSWKVAVFNT